MDQQLYRGSIAQQKSHHKMDVVEAMHKRVANAFALDYSSMEIVYAREKNYIEELDRNIAEPPASVWKKGKYRDKKKKERQRLLTAYSEAYGIQMNNEVYETEIAFNLDKEFDKYTAGTFDGIYTKLYTEMQNELNMQEFVNGLKSKKELTANKQTRVDLLAQQIDTFNRALQADITLTSDQAKDMVKGVGLEKSPGIWSKLLADYMTVKNADGVDEKKFSGIDFMAERYPKLLVMLAYQRMLAQMDAELSSRLEKQDISKKNDPIYAAFLQQKLILGNISAELQMKPVREGVFKEYFWYKRELRGGENAITQEDQEHEAIILYNVSDSEINRVNKWPEFFPRYKAWKNNPAHEADMDAFNSNDIVVLRSLKEKYPEDYLLKRHIDYRIEQLEKINEVKKVDLINKKYTLVNKGKAKKEDFELKGINHVTQTSFNGCWSVVLMEMLANEGINLDQRTIRCHHGEFDKNIDVECGLLQNTDTSVNMEVHMNLINKCLPNTAFHKVDYNMVKLSPRLVKSSFKQLIIKVVKEQKSPLAIRYHGHFRLVAGMKGDTLRVYDPLYNNMQNVNIDSIFDTIQYDGNDKFLDCYYLGNIAITDNKPTFEQKLECGRILSYNEKGELENEIDPEVEENKVKVDGMLINTTNFEDYHGFIVSSETTTVNSKQIDQPIETIYVPTKLKLQEQKLDPVDKGNLEKQIGI